MFCKSVIMCPEGDGGAEDYYKEGQKNVPEDWVEVEYEDDQVKSGSFKEFLKNNGKDPKGWKKVMEKWADPNKNIYQRHYWTNGSQYYYHGEGIEIFIPH